MNEVPAEVRKFLYEHVETLEELEVLVFLARNPQSAWTAEELEMKLQIPFGSVSSAFHTLRKSGMCEVAHGSEEPAYLLPRRDPVLRMQIERMAAVYEVNRFGIIKLLSEAAMDRVRGSMTKAFADAFVLGGKKRRDG